MSDQTTTSPTKLPVARSWRVKAGNRWRAESICLKHMRNTTRFVQENADGTWRFRCSDPEESHDFDARPRAGAERPPK